MTDYHPEMSIKLKSFNICGFLLKYILQYILHILLTSVSSLFLYTIVTFAKKVKQIKILWHIIDAS